MRRAGDVTRWRKRKLGPLLLGYRPWSHPRWQSGEAEIPPDWSHVSNICLHPIAFLHSFSKLWYSQIIQNDQTLVLQLLHCGFGDSSLSIPKRSQPSSSIAGHARCKGSSSKEVCGAVPTASKPSYGTSGKPPNKGCSIGASPTKVGISYDVHV